MCRSASRLYLCCRPKITGSGTALHFVDFILKVPLSWPTATAIKPSPCPPWSPCIASEIILLSGPKFEDEACGVGLSVCACAKSTFRWHRRRRVAHRRTLPIRMNLAQKHGGSEVREEKMTKMTTKGANSVSVLSLATRSVHYSRWRWCLRSSPDIRSVFPPETVLEC